MKNINELRANLSDLFTAIKEGSVDVKVAAEMNNTAGKIIASIKAQNEYAELRAEAPSIAFMHE
jgi:hypothetical protein